MTTADIPTPATRAPTAGRAHPVGTLRYLTFVGLVFLALMLALAPDVGFVAPLPARLLFWVLQIACGLFVLQSVLYLLTRRFGAGRAPSWLLVLLSGVFGAVVLAPAYWLIGKGLMETWLGYPVVPDDDSAGRMGLGLSHPLVNEYFDIVGPVTAAWALICLPRLHWLVPPLLHGRTQPAVLALPPVAEAARDGTRRDAPVTSAPGPAFPAPVPATAAPAQAQPRAAWLARLPAELGTDVIAVASELQYLRVWTPRGCALILGALADVEAEGAGRGLRVHRSWWVASEHVVSVRRTATSAVCLMSDGRQVPVSRRRRAEVLERFGDGAQYRVASASKAVADTDLH